MLHLSPEKKISPRNTKRIATSRRGNYAVYLLSKRNRSPLIRIDDENPLTRRARNRRISLRTNRRERIRHHGRAGRPGKINRIVRGIVFYNDDLASPTNTR